MDGLASPIQIFDLRISFVSVELCFVGFEDVIGVLGSMSITAWLGLRGQPVLNTWRGL